MEANELFDLEHLILVATDAAVQALHNGAHVAENRRVHERYSFHQTDRKLGANNRIREVTTSSHLHPMSMTEMEKSFSLFVFGDMLPNPTLVKLPTGENKTIINDRSKILKLNGRK